MLTFLSYLIFDTRFSLSCPIIDTCCFRESRYPLFIVAPEGTTKHKHCLLTFAKGAFAPGLPVMPVLLKYSSVRFNPGWGIVYTAWHFFRVFNQFKNNVEVEVLPIYYPSPGVNTADHLLLHCRSCLCRGSVGAPRQAHSPALQKLFLPWLRWCFNA